MRQPTNTYITDEIERAEEQEQLIHRHSSLERRTFRSCLQTLHKESEGR